ncbi:hypothetical protein TRV_03054 [Trichophyton verrucosum HKI 0517]|uniref:glutamate-5-semialdehyde dehydrogenase n=1 Tax=Trichophyton verrucosum (strain HKI 0517) TaxID=663202 RepID=D4D7H2_TRIVH|nr:uncharacterized protein TRV_03054 [Trichophyton verrucosum HKI 0517]EFE42212.1 hypothetical protein TRV_03054 [Trichophyton verrucosum HKI 0517]
MSLTESSPAEIAKLASAGARQLAILSSDARNKALVAIHDALKQNKDVILQANSRDVEAATNAVEKGDLSLSILKRLDLARPGKYDDMLKGILDVKNLEDPIIANIAALSIKSGNAAILKGNTDIDRAAGGKESTESFIEISRVIAEAAATTEVPKAAVQLVKTRDAILPLLALDDHIDLVIPRGSNDLVKFVKTNTKIPVLGHADGRCAIYLHSDADVNMAERVILDSKLHYPAACNAAETLLVDERALSTIFPRVAAALTAKGVTMKCDPKSKAALQDKLDSNQLALLKDATEEDYSTEFLEAIIAVKTVEGTSDQSYVDAAISHIGGHSSKHTDVILTSTRELAERFLSAVDSAGVYWNASSRMADGMRYGFGTEVGISTNKIHSRGPVGLEGLTIYKYLIRGEGHIAGDYFQGEGGRTWKHEKMDI